MQVLVAQDRGLQALQCHAAGGVVDDRACQVRREGVEDVSADAGCPVPPSRTGGSSESAVNGSKLSVQVDQDEILERNHH